MSDKILVKEEKLEHMLIRWEIDPQAIDFAMRVYLEEKPPVLVRLFLEIIQDFMYFDDEVLDEYKGGAFYKGDTMILTHLGCVLPATEEDLKKNIEIIEKNKEGIVKIYEGAWEEHMKVLHNIDASWEKIKKLEEEFFKLVWKGKSKNEGRGD